MAICSSNCSEFFTEIIIYIGQKNSKNLVRIGSYLHSKKRKTSIRRPNRTGSLANHPVLGLYFTLVVFGHQRAVLSSHRRRYNWRTRISRFYSFFKIKNFFELVQDPGQEWVKKSRVKKLIFWGKLFFSIIWTSKITPWGFVTHQFRTEDYF